MVLAVSSCRSMTGGIFDDARDRAREWWIEEGRAEAEALAVEAGKKATEAAVEKAQELLSAQIDGAKSRLSAHGVDPASIQTLGDAIGAASQVRAREQETGEPYTGNLYLDLALIVIAARYGSKGLDKTAPKLIGLMARAIKALLPGGGTQAPSGGAPQG